MLHSNVTHRPRKSWIAWEKRVGPEGRKLFERFLRRVNKLQAQQQLEAQAQTGDNRQAVAPPM